MKFEGNIQETIFVADIVPERSYMFNQDLKTGLSVVWNTGEKATLFIDQQEITLEKNCIVFLTEFHHIDQVEFEQLRVIQFNRAFYCVEKHDSEVGCRGVLFFGASSIPKIQIEEQQFRPFALLWEIFMMEVDHHDDFSLEMLRTLLKRFLILCVRIYQDQSTDFKNDQVDVGIVREFHYLVEKHYKTYTKVSEYAELLFKSPKTLSNIFNKFQDKTPIQVINERRMLEAKRLLIYTDEGIQQIADELNFIDIQAFSNFFKSREGSSPTKFRKEVNQ